MNEIADQCHRDLKILQKNKHGMRGTEKYINGYSTELEVVFQESIPTLTDIFLQTSGVIGVIT